MKENQSICKNWDSFRGKIIPLLLSVVIFALCIAQSVHAQGVSPDTSAILEMVLINGRPASLWELQAVQIIRYGRRIPTQLNMWLISKDTINTSPWATVVITFPGRGSITIGPNTSIQILSPKFFIWLGEVFASLKGALGWETEYVSGGNVETEFFVMVDRSNNVTVSVFDGTVRVQSKLGLWQPVLVGKGEQFIVRGQGFPEKSPIGPRYPYKVPPIPAPVAPPGVPPYGQPPFADMLIVPDVTKMHLVEAKSVLNRARLRVGRMTYVESQRYQQDIVINQSPSAGTQVYPGTPVHLEIARPVPYSPPPSPSPTPLPTPTPTPSPTPTNIPFTEPYRPTPPSSPTPTPTSTPTLIPTPTPTSTPTLTPTPTPTSTPTPTPTPTWTPTPTPIPIVLYDAGGDYKGDLGGRAGANAKCAASSNRPSAYSKFLAFLSVESGDAISDMPQNYGVPKNVPIQGINRTKIADNWDDLLDGKIQKTLAAAGILPNGSMWWSGSKFDGSVRLNRIEKTPTTCNAWTSLRVLGVKGSAGADNAEWIGAGVADCQASYKVLCIAY